MKARKLLVGVLAALAIASLLAAVPRSRRAEGRAAQALTVETSLTPVLSLYVNGKLVHQGVDPATYNFMKILAYVLAGTDGPQLVDTSGSVFTMWMTTALGPLLPSASIAFGDDSQAFFRGIYALVHEIDSGLASYSEGYNATHAWFTLSRSYIASANVTIKEVGLKAQVSDGNNYHWVLLLYTPVNVPLNPGDNLTAVYTFYFRGLSKNVLGFWKIFTLTPLSNGAGAWGAYYEGALVDEGGNAITLVSNSYVIGTGSYARHWRYYAISNAVVLALGTGTNPPSMNDYRLQNKVLEGRAGVGLMVEDGRVVFVATVVPPSDCTVSEVGVFVIANDEASYAAYFYKFLIMRYVLPAPVQLKAGKPVSIAWTIKLP